MKKIIIALAIFLISPLVCADLTLPYLIEDGMVVQRDKEIPFWGKASPRTEVVVSFNKQRKKITADSNGDWRVSFSPLSAGGPYQVEFENEGLTKTIADVLVGDVWVCSGQSNMEWPLRSVDNAESEIAAAGDNHIRHFAVPKSWALAREQELAGGDWQVATAETSPHFSAVCFLFAKYIREKKDIPIGLIHSSWGGSNIESWMDAPQLGMTPQEAQENIEKLMAVENKDAEAVVARVKQWPDALADSYSDADWSGTDVEQSDWVSIQAPMLWESQGFNGLDGVAWYRTTFELSESEVSDAMLGLSRIDDHDVTWVNGNKVGETKAYDELRQYSVPKEFLQVGTNTIAVRVEDTGGGGGIYSAAKDLFIATESVRKSLQGTWQFKVDKGRVSIASNRNHTPTALYNKMMHPLFNTNIKGVLWYQGETNAESAEQAVEYRDEFRVLIQDLRKKWNDPSMPFYWVQLANWISGGDNGNVSPWAILRESQSAALELNNTAQAVAIDVGNPTDIHPRDKQTVAKRLALSALKNIYGVKNINASGPIYKNMKIKGNAITVNFDDREWLALRAGSGEELKGFSIAGPDQQYYPAQATIKGTSVIVSSELVLQPNSVRYAWSDNPENANLVDKEGLPAGPFRAGEKSH